MGDMNGTWKLDRNENFEEYLKEIGMGMVKRKIAGATTPVMEIKQNGNHFYIKNTSAVSSNELDFDAGTSFDTEIPGITSCKWACKSSFEGGKLILECTPGPADKGMKPTTIIRERAGDELLQSLICGSVTGKRYYKKV